MLPIRHVASGTLLLCLASPGAPAPGVPATRTARPPVPAPASSASAGQATQSRREMSAERQLIHVLERLGFGARPGDVEQVRQMGVDRWIERQLHPDRIDDRATEALLARYETLRMSTAELYQRFPPPALAAARARQAAGQSMGTTPTRQDTIAVLQAARRSNQFVTELTSARVARAVVTERQLEEVMVDFWENHFSVFSGKAQLRFHLTAYDRDVIRPHALGKFRALLEAVAKSPAMLIYLDNEQSVADSTRPTLAPRATPEQMERVARAAARRQPAGGGVSEEERMRLLEQAMARRPRGLNENYARELLELHTLGVDGGYTQQDVIEVARALTGWGVVPPRRYEQVQQEAARRAANPRRGARPAPVIEGAFIFRPDAHDAAEKVVLGRRLKSGRGIEDGEQVLDILASHPSTARHIARKLAVRFVSDEPSDDLVDRAAATFTRTKGDIREVVRTIVTSPEFFANDAWRAKVKSPFEVVVSALRAMEAEPDLSPRTAQVVARLGQPIFGHQAPNGWPETGEAWMNTGAILNRINFGIAVAAERLPGVSLARWSPAPSLRTAPRAQQVDGVIRVLLGGEVSPETRQVLVSGENPLLARPGADTLPDVAVDDTMMPPAAPPARRQAQLRGQGRNNPMAAATLPDGLAQVVGLALGSPEFQRR